jgi:hypothetical protein
VKKLGDKILIHVPGARLLGMIIAPSTGASKVIVALNLDPGLECKTRGSNIKAPKGVPLRIRITVKSNLMVSCTKMISSSSSVGKAKEGMYILV